MSEDRPVTNGNDGRSPVSQLPSRDYGAETHRNYRYQSAYGVALLVGAASKKNDYIAIWCEIEDDILCQISERLFDSYQIKTRKPELGHWQLTDDELVRAIKVFLSNDQKYPGCFRRFHFVSNAECLESDAKKTTHLCPKRLAAAAKNCSSWTELPPSQKQGFEELLAKTEGNAEALFSVLQRLTFVKAPDRDSFIAELAQNHLRELDWCQLSQRPLETVVRSLIEMVDSASSLSSQDSVRHLPIESEAPTNAPQLTAKRITAERFILRSRELASPAFRYLPSLTTHPLANTSKDLKRFNAKLHKGGLDDYADSLRNQTLSAEATFLDLVTRDSEGQAQLTQVENVVKSECDAAHLRAAQGVKPFGQRMLIDVQDRLRAIASNEPAKVSHQPYEVLIGMAGLLTETCPVWWSEKFNMEEIS